MAGIEGLAKLPELRKRILFTIALVAVYRIGVFVPVPGINIDELKIFMQMAQGTVFGVFNLFSGGAFQRFSIFSLGVAPYISASIIVWLLQNVVPHFEQLSKEGDLGKKRLTQYSRYGTILLCLIQGYGISLGLENIQVHGGGSPVIEPGLSFRLMTMLTLATGTAFIMWLGERINEKGIGNGISMIIFSGIAADIPRGFMNSVQHIQSGEWSLMKFLVILSFMVGAVAFIIFIESSERRIPIQQPRRVVGRKMYAGQSSYLPLKINNTGVYPPIFASSLLLFPATLATFVAIPFLGNLKGLLDSQSLGFNLLYVTLIVFFTYFFTAMQIKPEDTAENLKKGGGFIPGIRPGQNTADYVDYILSRITLGGAIYLALVCVLPAFFYAKINAPFRFGGTSLLILIGVALSTVQQIQMYLLSRNYEGLMKDFKIQGRRG